MIVFTASPNPYSCSHLSRVWKVHVQLGHGFKKEAAAIQDVIEGGSDLLYVEGGSDLLCVEKEVASMWREEVPVSL